MKAKTFIINQPDLNPTDLSISQIKALDERELEAEIERFASPFRRAILGYFASLVFRGRLRKICELDEHEYFMKYLHDLGLAVDDLKGKKVIDLGARDRIFAAYCLHHGINREVISVDPNFNSNFRLKKIATLLKGPSLGELAPGSWNPSDKNTIDRNTIGARYQNLPFKSGTIDLAVVHNAFPGIAAPEADRSQIIDTAFQEMGRILRPSGETRISSYTPGNMDSEWVAEVDHAIEKLMSTGEFRVEFEQFEESHKCTIDDSGVHYDYNQPVPAYRIIIRRF